VRFLVGIIGFPLGIIIIVYRERVKRFTGDMGFAEKWFGSGGTYTAIMLFGFIVTIGSIMYAFGTLQALIIKILGPVLMPLS